ncbi:MAG: ATP-binding protein [Propionibacteriales bacterium]|nr:ATP-binding protein [Propionibacteriales bacterium]
MTLSPGDPAVGDGPGRQPVPEGGPGPLAPGTLARRLAIQMVALVALLSIVLGVLSTLVVRQLMVGQIDDQLAAATDRQGRASGGGPNRSEPPAGINLPGQPIGTVVMVVPHDEEPAAGVLTDNGVGRVTLVAVNQATATVAPGRTVSVDLDRLGHYRVTSRSTEEGTVLVGLPLNRVDIAIRNLVLLELVLCVAGMIVAGSLAGAMVARGLRPLAELSRTATRVSSTPLHRGEVELSDRVPDPGSHTGNEVATLGRSFNHMLDHVGEALDARQRSETRARQFVADASHELRNPLASIRGYAELTRRDRTAMPPQSAHAMARVESEAARMSGLVEDLLLLARLDSGPALELAEVDLSALAIDAISDARVAGPDHRWQVRLPETPVTAVGDQFRLHQVVVNLLANARTHTPPGTHVELGLAERPEQAGQNGSTSCAVITVTDDGPGIDPAVLGSVFERFTRADVARSRADGSTSTGLGLAIVAAVVEQHHGQVSVDSAPGRTRFTVTLPQTRSGAALDS